MDERELRRRVAAVVEMCAAAKRALSIGCLGPDPADTGVDCDERCGGHRIVGWDLDPAEVAATLSGVPAPDLGRFSPFTVHRPGLAPVSDEDAALLPPVPDAGPRARYGVLAWRDTATRGASPWWVVQVREAFDGADPAPVGRITQAPDTDVLWLAARALVAAVLDVGVETVDVEVDTQSSPRPWEADLDRPKVCEVPLRLSVGLPSGITVRTRRVIDFTEEQPFGFVDLAERVADAVYADVLNADVAGLRERPVLDGGGRRLGSVFNHYGAAGVERWSAREGGGALVQERLPNGVWVPGVYEFESTAVKALHAWLGEAVGDQP